jgi:hypothetical protein
MHADIPPIAVITGMSDATDEDFVAQLLHSQGWKITFRSIDWIGAEQALSTAQSRTAFIYSSDLRGLVISELEKYESENLILINIDQIPIASHPIMTVLRSKVRSPYTPRLLESATAPEPRATIVVTGSTGAPGRSSVALALSEEFSKRKSIELVDADMDSQTLDYLIGERELAKNFTLLTVDIESKPAELPPIGAELRIIDCGALPPLRDVVNDRRWKGSLMHEIITKSQCILYVVKSDGLGLLKLESFMSELPLLTKKVPVIYILNQLGGTRVEKSVSERFATLMSDRSHFMIPHESRGGVLPSLGKAQSGLRSLREVDKIAALITSQLR